MIDIGVPRCKDDTIQEILRRGKGVVVINVWIDVFDELFSTVHTYTGMEGDRAVICNVLAMTNGQQPLSKGAVFVNRVS